MRYFLCVFTIMFFSLSHAQNVNLAWAKSIGGASADYGYSIAVDASGNVYTTGSFSGTADFDPGAGTYNLTSAGFLDIFISKLDASGNFVWAKSIGDAHDDAGNSIRLDASGNVYTTGYFIGTVDFDPGPGTYNLISTAGAVNDIFVSKLDAFGNFVWAKKMGGSGDDKGYSVSVDASGNVYTTGSFQATSDFDPGIGTYNLNALSNTDMFVSKLDASGNFVWAKNIGGGFNNSFAVGLSIAVDASGNVYTTGYFIGIVDFDPGAATYNLTAGSFNVSFISKLDASGNFVWAKEMGSGGYGAFGNSIVVDASGNAYTTGYFGGTADFDPGTGIDNLTSFGNYDIFISKLNASGNFVWAKNMGDTNDDLSYSIGLDASGNVYTTGYFQGAVDFDPGPGTFYLTSGPGSYNIFVSKLDALGNFVWAGDDASGATGNSIAVDASGNIYTTGYFTGIADFDPGTSTVNLTSAGSYDIFILKLSQAASQTIWNGSVSNIWSDPANWNSGVVPGITSDVLIPSGLTRYPTIFSSTEIKSLFLQTGASVMVGSSIQLKINGQ